MTGSDDCTSPKRIEFTQALPFDIIEGKKAGWTVYISIQTLEETKRAATAIAAVLRAGDVLLLDGPMGAGKTTLAAMIAEALGCEGAASSPTFSIAQQYDGPLPVWHLDLYRLEQEDLYDIGYEDYFYPEEAVTLIEWPDRAGALLPKNALRIEFQTNPRKLRIDDRLQERVNR